MVPMTSVARKTVSRVIHRHALNSKRNPYTERRPRTSSCTSTTWSLGAPWQSPPYPFYFPSNVVHPVLPPPPQPPYRVGPVLYTGAAPYSPCGGYPPWGGYSPPPVVLA